LSRLTKIVDAVLIPLGIAAEIAVGLMCLHIVVEIVANSVFRMPIEGTTEIVARWYMVALVFLPLAIIQRRNGHIKAGVFTDLLSPRALMLLEACIAILMAAFSFLFAWYSGIDAVEATKQRESFELMRGTMTVWPTRWFVPIGFATMGFVALLCSARGFAAARAHRVTDNVIR
jgi:TRAP-type C4-dicarboxylate transport system permease small subunit